jgi:alpha-mannosidase
VLENTFLRATIGRDAGWGITSLIDKRSSQELIRPGDAGNTFVVYTDDGGLYRFGSEMQGCALTPRAAVAVSAAGTPLEGGPLRARFAARVVLEGQTFEKEYQLVAGEPFLRMLSTGAASEGTSVMVHFPLAGPVDELIHGTAYHWASKQPERAGGGLTFEATHDFVVPRFRGQARSAVFHAGVPAWAATRDGVVIGALWRNARREQCDFYGAEGTDPSEHVVSYALRTPGGVTAPQTGDQLREALAFSTPLLAVAARPRGALPRCFSLASASPRRAIVTVAKAGTTDPSELVLRIYQPTNAPLRVTVRSRFQPGHPLELRGMTALEVPLPPEQAGELELVGDADRFSFLARRALTTFGLRLATGRPTAPMPLASP